MEVQSLAELKEKSGIETYIFSHKEVGEILVAPFDSSIQLTELNLHPLFNFDPQKVL